MWVKRKDYDALCRRLVEVRDEREAAHAELMDYREATRRAGYVLINNRLAKVSSGEPDRELELCKRTVSAQGLVISQIVELLCDVEDGADALTGVDKALAVIRAAEKMVF